MKLIRIVLLTLLFSLTAISTTASIGSDGTPFIVVPADRWGDIEPGRIVYDSTHMAGREPGSWPHPFDLDIEGCTIVYANGVGWSVVNICNPAQPIITLQIGGKSAMVASGLTWASSGDKDHFLLSIDMPPGNSSIAIASGDEFGSIILNTSSAVGWYYQDTRYFVQDAYAARLPDGREYGFTLSLARGITLYDLTSAANKIQCKDTISQVSCGVYEGVLSIPVVLGNTINGIDDFIVVRSGNNGLRVYQVSGAAGFASLVPRLDVVLPNASGEAILWKYNYGESEKYYLATLIAAVGQTGKFITTLHFYDVDFIRGGLTINSLPSPIASYDVTDNSKNNALQNMLTLSYDDGRPYLYVGNPNAGSPIDTTSTCITQREFPLDLSRYDGSIIPSLAMLDITPEDENFWGWYYQECNEGKNGGPGFNGVMPRRMKFAEGYGWRVGGSFADSFKVKGKVVEPGPEPEPEPDPDPPPTTSDTQLLHRLELTATGAIIEIGLTAGSVPQYEEIDIDGKPLLKNTAQPFAPIRISIAPRIDGFATDITVPWLTMAKNEVSFRAKVCEDETICKSKKIGDIMEGDRFTIKVEIVNGIVSLWTNGHWLEVDYDVGEVAGNEIIVLVHEINGWKIDEMGIIEVE